VRGLGLRPVHAWVDDDLRIGSAMPHVHGQRLLDLLAGVLGNFAVPEPGLDDDHVQHDGHVQAPRAEHVHRGAVT